MDHGTQGCDNRSNSGEGGSQIEILGIERRTAQEYVGRLKLQAQDAFASVMRTVPVVLFSGQTEAENDIVFTRWARRARRMPSLRNIQKSASLVEFLLEREKRFDFANEEAKGQLRSFCRTRYAAAATDLRLSAPAPAAAATSSTPTSASGKRHGSTEPEDDV
uniref:Uncharacterized protein n=1 Tax=Peronospora matthiolae TaxID=2874970 RepID=A0AAV1TJR3_9STRA